MSSNTFKKLQRFSADLGWLNTCLYGFGVLLHRINTQLNMYKYCLVAQPVREKPLLPARRPPTVEVRMVDREDYDFTWFPRPREIIESRYRQGAVCFVAFKEGSPMGCLWLLLGSYKEDEVRCLFMPSPAGLAAWDFDMYLHPRYRAGRAFAYLWDVANAWLCERGTCWTMSRINAFNSESIRSHRRLGAREVGVALFFCFGTGQLLLANVRPFFHLSFSRNRFPTIAVEATAPNYR